MGVSMIPVNAWMHLESFEVFILPLVLSFLFFLFSEALSVFSWACISFFSLCFIDIDNTPQCLQILFFGLPVVMLWSYLYTNILFISRW